jgi:hypothetical protein
MRRRAPLVVLLSLSFSIAAADVHADSSFVSRPIQPISLTLEPRLTESGTGSH